MKTAAQYSLIDGSYGIIEYLERGCGARLTSSETGLHSGEGTVGIEMVNIRQHTVIATYIVILNIHENTSVSHDSKAQNLVNPTALSDF